MNARSEIDDIELDSDRDDAIAWVARPLSSDREATRWFDEVFASAIKRPDASNADAVGAHLFGGYSDPYERIEIQLDAHA